MGNHGTQSHGSLATVKDSRAGEETGPAFASVTCFFIS